MLNVKIIKKDALVNNYLFCVSKCKRVMAIVKANAYGHGMRDIATILEKYCDWFGVATFDEAIELSEILNHKKKILVIGKSENYYQLIKNRIHITVDNIEDIHTISKICKLLKKKAYIHIAINTGMNRIGVKTVEEYKAILDEIRINNSIVLVGIFTHMFDSDKKDNHNINQLLEFEKYVNQTNRKVLVHIGGSYCINNFIPSYVDFVRVGYFLYGYGNECVKPVMEITSRIIKIVKCNHGENVGYGSNVLKKNRTIAIVPFGYADGLPQRISNKGYVLVNNTKCRIIAKVCMDSIIVDISKTSAVVGDTVKVLFDAEKIANWAGTSNYEVLTNFGKSRTKSLII